MMFWALVVVAINEYRFPLPGSPSQGVFVGSVAVWLMPVAVWMGYFVRVGTLYERGSISLQLDRPHPVRWG